MSWRLAILLAAALALRLAIAPLPSYWVDEAFTIHLLGHDFGGMLERVTETESTPPLYYALAWLWSQVAGIGELGLRSLSALAGTATVGLAWALGRWVAGPRAALAAGALAAVNPFLLWFSSEARAYALAAALTTAALLLLVQLLDRGPADESDGRRLAGWAALAAGALLTHYATAFVIGAQAVVLLHRRGTRATWAAVVSVVAVGAALIPLAVAQRGNDFAQALDGFGKPLAERVAQIPKQFAIGYDAPLENVAGGVTIVLLLLGGVLVLLSTPELRERASVLLTVGVAGVLAPIAASFAGLDVVSSRYLLPALPPLLVVAAAGLTAATRSRLGPALVAGLVGAWLAVAVAVARDPLLQTRADWQGVERALGPAPAGGRAIVVTPASGALVLGDAYRVPGHGQPARPVVEVVLAATEDIDDGPPGLPTTTPAFAATGFELTEQRHERGYVLQRWRAATPRPVDPTLLEQAGLTPATPPALLWQP